MFEYAAGLFFQEKFSRRLEIVRPIAKHANWRGYPRPFQLNMFSVGAPIREAGPLDRFFFSTNPRLTALHGSLGSAIGAQLLGEPVPYEFHPALEDDSRKRATYMTGNWQAAGYAQSMEPTLREEFVLPDSGLARNQKYTEAIQSLRWPVSVHVRVGDYSLIKHDTQSGPKQTSMVLLPRYYQRAIAGIREIVPEPALVVFSDDLAAARSLFNGMGDCLFVEGNDASAAYEDLRLMSLCKHHIIANSSFSWWGAWLNPDPQKRVFAPRFWGNTASSHFPDLYPPGWTVIDNLGD